MSVEADEEIVITNRIVMTENEMAIETVQKKGIYEGVIRPNKEDELLLIVAHLEQFVEIASMRNEIVAVQIWFEESENKRDCFPWWASH